MRADPPPDNVTFPRHWRPPEFPYTAPVVGPCQLEEQRWTRHRFDPERRTEARAASEAGGFPVLRGISFLGVVNLSDVTVEGALRCTRWLQMSALIFERCPGRR